MSDALYIGLMSGTSTDGVDGLLLDCAAPPHQAVRAFATRPFADSLRAEFLALNHAGSNELHRAALAGNALARVYAQVVADLLAQTGLQAQHIQAIGAHGQTVRHQPQMHDACGYTLQINQSALLAELTGVTTVADFRSRDVAAGGQGAPLTPLFHRAWWGAQTAGAVAVLNIGGISNLSLWQGDALMGFDCGPGNALMDAWISQQRGEHFDVSGRWAASGRVQEALLVQMLAESYFQQAAPKSTGRDLFSLAWLEQQLQTQARVGLRFAAEDVQATLLELTARTIADSLLATRGLGHRHDALDALVVCGGGAYNLALMQRLQSLLPQMQVQSSQAYGLAPNQVEAAAFAWLAQAALERRVLPVAGITGARGARVLGCIYPA